MSDLVECDFGIHVKDETPFINAVKMLGVDAYADRDKAMKFLRKDLRSTYKFIHDKGKNSDAETARRIELLLKECGVGFRINDVVRTKDANFSGVLKQDYVAGVSDSLGELKVDLSKVNNIAVRMTRTVVKIGQTRNWTPVSWVAGGKLKIKAAGQIDLYPQGPGQYVSSPDGYGTSTVGAYLPGALIGRIGQREFLIGSELSASGMENGRLELMVNRAMWAGDGLGEYEVEIE